MYHVVEFTEDGGGGVSLIRRDWLTPEKQRCMWPPQRLMAKWSKCVDGSIVADTTWDTFKIKGVFYETDSLAKAREKAKQAEIESEINSDHSDKLVRKRKKTRKINDSDDDDTSDGNTDDNAIVYPTLPATKLGSDGNKTSTGEYKHRQNRYAVRRPVANYNSDQCDIEKYQKKVAVTKVRSTPGTSTDEECIAERYQKQVNTTNIHSTPGTSTDEECVTGKHQKQIAATKVHSTPGTSTGEDSLPNLSSLDLTITPFLKESASSQALDVIAKHLARIETDIRELQISQREILQRVRSSSFTPLMENSLPEEINLPCEDKEALFKIETWINNSTKNGKLMVTYLSLVGGNKTPIIIRRILEKLFTNKLAGICNWKGKNNKIPLKYFELIKIIRDAVRQNQIAANATDAEIHEVISNWFRFTKDRNGGREARRLKQSTSCLEEVEKTKSC